MQQKDMKKEASWVWLCHIGLLGIVLCAKAWNINKGGVRMVTRDDYDAPIIQLTIQDFRFNGNSPIV